MAAPSAFRRSSLSIQIVPNKSLPSSSSRRPSPSERKTQEAATGVLSSELDMGWMDELTPRTKKKTQQFFLGENQRLREKFAQINAVLSPNRSLETSRLTSRRSSLVGPRPTANQPIRLSGMITATILSLWASGQNLDTDEHSQVLGQQHLCSAVLPDPKKIHSLSTREETNLITGLDLFNVAMITQDHIQAIIQTFPKLVSISFMASGIDDEAITPLNSLSLQSLDFHHCPEITTDALTKLPLTTLTSFGLSMDDEIPLSIFEKLAQSPNLKDITLSCAQLNPAALEPLKKAVNSNLTVHLTGCRRIPRNIGDQINTSRKHPIVFKFVEMADSEATEETPRTPFSPSEQLVQQQQDQIELLTKLLEQQEQEKLHTEILQLQYRQIQQLQSQVSKEEQSLEVHVRRLRQLDATAREPLMREYQQQQKAKREQLREEYQQQLSQLQERMQPDALSTAGSLPLTFPQQDVPLTNDLLDLLSDVFPNTPEIHIANEPALSHLGPLKQFPKLTSLSLDNLNGIASKQIEQMCTFPQGKPAWNNIQLKNIPISDRALAMIAELPELTHLTLDNCTSFTYQGFLHLMNPEKALKLQELNIDRCPSIDAMALWEFQKSRPAVTLNGEALIDESAFAMAKKQAVEGPYSLPETLFPADQVSQWPNLPSGREDYTLQVYMSICRTCWAITKQLLQVGFFLRRDGISIPHTADKLIELLQKEEIAKQGHLKAMFEAQTDPLPEMSEAQTDPLPETYQYQYRRKIKTLDLTGLQLPFLPRFLEELRPWQGLEKILVEGNRFQMSPEEVTALITRLKTPPEVVIAAEPPQ